MELVCAVYLACARTTTAERAHVYHSHIVHYVENLKTIYPTFALHPNHHAAFHIYNYLLLFGPVSCMIWESCMDMTTRYPPKKQSLLA
ncbi:hypothetical protein DFJ58DRAFT_654533 [Suillus subalutaceus]|uniref:uncharacterized protein n=1 Tax=Suillus subalutaceus TaxID=48586 RepID=UPI001B8864F0|nr:uncharacterized protein DFJ58DRAFT_654533 [Suillus subalutaceus]KAG1867179.1 hypothetical protein DFJ58DRAFT_654533 [Suillus subalutaceus]